MTRVLLDQGISPIIACLLRERGFDAIHVCELGMERAEDTQILEIARIESRVCVTLDHDFHSHLAATGHGRPSVVLLRVQSLDSRGQAELIEAILRQCELVLAEGAAISADREKSESAVSLSDSRGEPHRLALALAAVRGAAFLRT